MVGCATRVSLPGTLDRRNATIVSVTAHAGEQLLPRFCGLLAQFGVIPDTLICRQAEGLLIIDVQFEALQPEREQLLLAKILAIVQVRRASARMVR